MRQGVMMIPPSVPPHPVPSSPSLPLLPSLPIPPYFPLPSLQVIVCILHILLPSHLSYISITSFQLGAGFVSDLVPVVVLLFQLCITWSDGKYDTCASGVHS